LSTSLTLVLSRALNPGDVDLLLKPDSSVFARRHKMLAQPDIDDGLLYKLTY